jgi:hypothetical protein
VPAEIITELSITTGPSVISENVRAVPPEEWGATDLMEYVRSQIRAIHGPQPVSRHDLAVFEGFIERFGSTAAVRVARAAFEAHGGMWMGAPIGTARFGPSSDACFAQRILASA